MHLYLYDDPKIMTEASWILLNSTQKVNERIIDLFEKHEILETFKKKIELENLTEQQEEVILTFLEEYLKKTMRFKAHKDIKLKYREGVIMEFLKRLSVKKYKCPNGLKAYNMIAKYFKDIKEELQTISMEDVNQ